MLLAAGAVSAAHPQAPRGTGGAVSSAEPLATRAGLDVLELGGNAVDAAVATALALAVVEPQAGNLLGGGFAVGRVGSEVFALDFREVAPAAAGPDTFLDETGEPVPDASRVGPLAAGVPGTPAGLHALHEKHGRLPWRRVVAPAIRLARRGAPVSEALHETLADKSELLARFPESEATWLREGRPPATGERLKRPALAHALRAYARRGPAALTSGPLAAAIVAVSRSHGGVLTEEDLAAYEPRWREPVAFRLGDLEVVSMPLPSAGGLLMAETAALLEAREADSLPARGAARLHLLAEALRRASADRFLLGDPTTVEVEPQALLAPDRLARLAARLPTDRAAVSADLAPGAGTEAAARRSGETTHLSVADADGGVVSLTTTLNGWFGCGLWIPEVGAFLNNEMDDFATAPGRPNMFGLVQGEANAVRPGKRMLSSMSPTVAWRRTDDGVETFGLGSPGGSRIPTATLQVLLALAWDGDDLATAVGRPRVHHQWLPDRLDHEPDALAPETRDALAALGHELGVRERIGRVNAVRVGPGGELSAWADPRGGGAAAVVDPLPGTRGTSLTVESR